MRIMFSSKKTTNKMPLVKPATAPADSYSTKPPKSRRLSGAYHSHPQTRSLAVPAPFPSCLSQPLSQTDTVDMLHGGPLGHTYCIRYSWAQRHVPPSRLRSLDFEMTVTIGRERSKKKNNHHVNSINASRILSQHSSV